MPYFVIAQYDTDALVCQYTKDELIAALPDILREGDGDVVRVITDSDPAMWGGSALIIKGEIVVPREKSVVKEWDIE